LGAAKDKRYEPQPRPHCRLRYERDPRQAVADRVIKPAARKIDEPRGRLRNHPFKSEPRLQALCLGAELHEQIAHIDRERDGSGIKKNAE
jgi:hypothetical protein